MNSSILPRDKLLSWSLPSNSRAYHEHSYINIQVTFSNYRCLWLIFQISRNIFWSMVFQKCNEPWSASQSWSHLKSSLSTPVLWKSSYCPNYRTATSLDLRSVAQSISGFKINKIHHEISFWNHDELIFLFFLVQLFHRQRVLDQKRPSPRGRWCGSLSDCPGGEVCWGQISVNFNIRSGELFALIKYMIWYPGDQWI